MITESLTYCGTYADADHANCASSVECSCTEAREAIAAYLEEKEETVTEKNEKSVPEHVLFAWEQEKVIRPMAEKEISHYLKGHVTFGELVRELIVIADYYEV